MEALGAELACRLNPGDVVLLSGEMGTGKTTLVRGAARALGYTGPVTSPTYVLANRYEGGSAPIAHLDLHRLESLASDDEGLLDDHLTDDAVAFVEWPEVAEPALPGQPRATVTLGHAGSDRRTVTVTMAV
jgi:tRNA threonylcarbamoyladenosine biosynthesis protein TsaE